MIDGRVSRRGLSRLAASVVAGLTGAGRLLTPRPAAAQEQKPNAPKPKRLNRLIEALESGQPAITGEHWVFADFEHSSYSIERIERFLSRWAETKNEKGQQPLAPIIRIPTEGDQPSRYIIKQVLERGAMGLIIPQVDTPEQVLKICQYARYPQRVDTKYPVPKGVRGFGGAAAPTWGISTEEYLAKADLWPLNPEGEIFLMPMIETPEGVKNIDAILDVPGVPGVLIGPSDLSMTYGRGPWNVGGKAMHHPDVEAAILTVAKASVAKKKYSGMVTWSAAETQKYLSLGFEYVYETSRKGSAPDRSLYL